MFRSVLLLLLLLPPLCGAAQEEPVPESSQEALRESADSNRADRTSMRELIETERRAAEILRERRGELVEGNAPPRRTKE